MRESYPSDITLEQFELIIDWLKAGRKVTRPYDYKLYDIFCAVLYLLKEGCTWRGLPHDFPKWSDVYYHFTVWSKKDKDGVSILDKVQAELVMSERIINGRNPNTSMSIIDSKSIKNTDTAEEKGYDGGKKVSGIKLHMGVDILGMPNAMGVTTANVTDREGALIMFGLSPDLLGVKKVLADSAYTGENFASGVKELLGAEVEVVKRSEMHKFVVIPKRWVVERTFGWLEKCRRLWKNCERKLHTTLQMTKLAIIALLLRRY